MRRTKIICTIGPKTCQYDHILKLTQGGMNIARLNLSHADHAWHKNVIRAIHTINQKGEHSVAILVDTKGSEVRSGDLKKEAVLKKGDLFTFTIKHEAEYPENTTEVSYDGFINEVKVGDTILIDSGLISFKVIEKSQTEIICQCLDGGVMTSRRHLNIRGKSSLAPTITRKDWEDIKTAVAEGIDFIALSFVKDPQSIKKLRNFLKEKKASVDIIAKIESAASLKYLDEIIEISDGLMIARGDLGAEVPLEDVPLLQEKIIRICRKKNRPVIVATHLLESMIVYPTPTRAEVTDIAQAVSQKADALMLSGETASGKYPDQALAILDRVARKIEERIFEEEAVKITTSGDIKMEIAQSATLLANNLRATYILVFTRRGLTATLLSNCRPKSLIYAFTNTTTVRRRLHLYWGVTSFRIDFSSDPEKTIQRAIAVLQKRNLVKKGDRIIIVSDILAGKEFIETIQYREIK